MILRFIRRTIKIFIFNVVNIAFPIDHVSSLYAAPVPEGVKSAEGFGEIERLLSV